MGGWGAKGIFAGGGSVYFPSVVMHVVVAAGAEEAHVVQVGVASHRPGDDMMGLAPAGRRPTPYTGSVPSYQSDALGWTGDPP